MRPVTLKVNVGVRHGTVAGDEPSAKDGLGKGIQNGIDHDFFVDANLASTVGNGPDTKESQ